MLMRAARERRGLTLQEVADRVGCAKSYLSALENERRSLPGVEVLEKIEAALGLDKGRLVRTANWQKSLEAGGVAVRKELEAMRQRDAAARELAKLLKQAPHGTGLSQPARAAFPHPLDAAYRSGELARLVHRIAPADPSSRSDAIPVPLPMEVPLINSVAAGYPTEFTDLGYPARVADEYVRCPDVHDPDAFAARVVGDSMEPAYFEGDIVIFSPAKALASGQDCFARIEPDQTSTFKRVFFEKNAMGQEVIRLQPLNSRYAPSVYPREQVAGLYAAVSVMRRIP
jgi:phage repressor protein C with HTH and peptisase S24 domain